MNKLILVVLAVVAFAGVVVAQQPSPKDGTDPLVAQVTTAWGKLRAASQSLECQLNVTNTFFARKSVLTGKVLYPKDVTTEMLVEATFDMTTGHFSIQKRGEEYNLTRQRVQKYEDKTVFKDGVLYGLLLPPDGKATGVGHGSDSSSDLAIMQGDLSSLPLSRDISPVLASVGIVPLSPVRELHAGNWSKYSVAALSDILFVDKEPSVLVTRDQLDKPLETRMYIGAEMQLLRRQVLAGGKVTDNLVYNFSKSPTARPVVSGWTREVSSGGQLYSRQVCVVKRLLINKDVSAPAITVPVPTPGMIVAKVDNSGAEQRNSLPKKLDHYVVKDDGEMELLRKAGTDAKQHVPTWKLGVIGACFFVIVVSVLHRLTRRNAGKRKE